MKRFLPYSIPVFILTFLLFFHPITEFSQDLGRHIKLGEIIWQSHSVPTTNLFSYTYPDFPFINTHWLSEVVFYLITKSFGTLGLLLVMSTIAAISVTLLSMLVLSFRGNAEKSKSILRSVTMPALPRGRFEMTIPLILTLGILLERTYLRPEIFSFFFMSIFLVVLYKWREQSQPHPNPLLKGEGKYGKNNLWLFLLPVVELLWVNMHIYFVMGPLLIFLFLVEPVILNLFQNLTKFSIYNFQFSINFQNAKYQILDTKYKQLATVFFLTCLATLLNPNSLAGALYPLNVLHNYGYTIAENQTLFFLINYGFRHWSYLFFGFSVVLLGALLIFKRNLTRPIDWLLYIVFATLGVIQIRNFPLFALATLPSIAHLLNKNTDVILGKHEMLTPESDSGRAPLARMTKKTYDNSTVAFLFILAPLALSIFILYLSITSQGIGYGIVPSAEKGVDFFIANNIRGPIFNNFDVGSYLIYRLYPSERVFIDGRPEAYPVTFFQDLYIPMQQDREVFHYVDQKYNFQSIFFSYTDQTPWARKFLYDIIVNPNYQLVYLDTFSAIWVKKDGTNQQLALTHPITESTLAFPQDPSLSAKDWYHLAYLFDIFEWKEQKMKVLQKIVDLDPKNCQALMQLSQNPTTQGLYSQSFQAYCQ